MDWIKNPRRYHLYTTTYILNMPQYGSIDADAELYMS